MAAVAVLLTVAACAELPHAPAFEGLRVGMTEEEFLHQGGRAFVPAASSGMAGEMGILVPPSPPAPTRYTRDHDEWTVWVYDVMKNVPTSSHSPFDQSSMTIRPPSAVADHREYAVFKNGRLESWRLGNP